MDWTTVQDGISYLGGHRDAVLAALVTLVTCMIYIGQMRGKLRAAWRAEAGADEALTSVTSVVDDTAAEARAIADDPAEQPEIKERGRTVLTAMKRVKREVKERVDLNPASKPEALTALKRALKKE